MTKTAQHGTDLIRGKEGWGMAVSGLDDQRDTKAVGADLARLRTTMADRYARCLNRKCDDANCYYLTPEAFVEMVNGHPDGFGFSSESAEAASNFAAKIRTAKHLPALLVCTSCKRVEFRSGHDNGSDGVFVRRHTPYAFERP